MLHEGASFVVESCKGELPNTKKGLLDICGVGQYTSGAIASICFKERVPAVDGNVLRVYSRLDKISLSSKDKVLFNMATEFCEKHVSETDTPGDLNQALMELGALICSPRKPQCSKCPVHDHCEAYKHSSEIDIEDLPLKKVCSDKAKPEFYVVAAVLENAKNEILCSRRANTGKLLSNQWELLCVQSQEEAECQNDGLRVKMHQAGICDICTQELLSTMEQQERFKHVFSHLHHWVTPMKVSKSDTCENPMCLLGDGENTEEAVRPVTKWVHKNQIAHAGLTRSMTKALQVCGYTVKL